MLRWLSICLIAALGAVLSGQALDRPRFDVASLKLLELRETTGSRGGVMVGGVSAGGTAQIRNPGRIMYDGISLRQLLALAYDFMPYQVPGPDWWDSVFYRFEAVMPPDTPGGRLQVMMQVLLEERLKLKVHRESKDMPVYVVEVARSGLRLHLAQPDPSTELDGSGPPKPSSMTYFKRTGTQTEKRITGTLSIPILLRKLMPDVDRPIVDRTGLDGRYEVSLTWAVSSAAPGGSPQTDGGNMGATAPGSDGPGSLFSSMEHQLGLKVEARKAAVEVLVVDHVERAPTNN